MATLSFFGEPNESGSISVLAAMALPLLVQWFLYFSIPEAISGKTRGKAVLVLEVVKTNGDLIGFRRALVRHLLDTLA